MCHHGRTRCPKWPLPVSQSPGVSQLLLSLQGDSPRSTSGSDPGTFQTTVSALKLEAYEILCMPCKNGISFTYGPSALLKNKPHLIFKTNCSRSSSSQCQTPGLGNPMCILDAKLLGQNLLFMSHQLLNMSLY